MLNVSGITLTGTKADEQLRRRSNHHQKRTGESSIADNALKSRKPKKKGAGADFALSFNTNFQSVAPGSTATFQLTVTPQGGFSGPITLTCADAPANAVCAVTTSGFTLNGAPATASVTLVTRAQTFAPAPSADGWRGVPTWQLQPALALIGLSFLLLVRSRRKPLAGHAATAQFACLLAGVIVLSALGLEGCGYTSHPATTSASYNLTVTATSGKLSHQSSVTVTAQ